MSSLAMVGTPLRLSGRAAKPTARRALVVRASADADRRKVLGGLVAGVVLVPATAVIAVDRVEREESGGQMSSLARRAQELIGLRREEPPQFAALNITDTKARVQDSRRALKDVMNDMEEGNWDESQNRLRGETGNLRSNMDNVVMNASDRNSAQMKTREFFAQIDRLDNAIRNQNRDKAMSAYDRVIDSLDRVMGEVAA